MSKIAIPILLFFLVVHMTLPVFAAASMEGSGDEIGDLIDSMDTYFHDYLPGLEESSKSAIRNYVRAGLTSQKDKYFMPMMSLLAGIRKAGQSGEAEGIKDVIRDYGKLSQSAQQNVVSCFTNAFQGIFMEVQVSKSEIMLFANQKQVTTISLHAGVTPTATPVQGQTASSSKPGAAATPTPGAAVSSPKVSSSPVTSSEAASAPKSSSHPSMTERPNTENPVDVTGTYFKAYLPKVDQKYIDEIKAFIKVYSQNGGAPGGSGALWRCIREIGELMGRKVEMEGDYSAFTVLEEGITEFQDLSPEVQEKVIAKVKEAMTGIAVTASYETGTFTFSKLGKLQFSYTVKGYQTPVSPTPKEDAFATEQKQASGVPYLIPAGIIAVAIVGFMIFKNNRKMRK